MSKRGAATGRKRVSLAESIGKYVLARNDAEPALNALRLSARNARQSSALPKPGRVPWSELANSWLTAQLKEAERDGDPIYFKLLIHQLLAGIDIHNPPAGVFTPWPRTGKPGRTVSAKNIEIYNAWQEMGRPSLYTSALAKQVFGSEYTKSNGSRRRQLRDECRQAVTRALEREPKKPAPR
jgi:hypothetical protein